MRGNRGFPMVPQSNPEEYIGKHGASVPSTRMISEFCPALHCHSCISPRINFFMSPNRFVEFTILYPLRFLSISQSSTSSILRPILCSDKRGVLFQVAEMILLDHRPIR